MNHLLKMLLFFVIILSLGACKKRKIYQAKKNLKDTFFVSQTNFHYLSAKARISYIEKDESSKARMNVRICKDSLIWASVHKTGVEGMRMIISQDSIFMINRIQKKYIKYSFNDLSNKYHFNFDFSLIQSILIGEMPIKKIKKMNKVHKKDGMYFVSQKTEIIKIDNYIDQKSLQLTKIIAKELSASNTLEISYSAPILLEENSFPSKILSTIKYKKNNIKLKANLNILYENFSTPSTLRFPFTVPKSYKK